MKWQKFTLFTTTQAEDLVSAALNDLGIEGVEILDHVPLTQEETRGMFIDILPELPEDRGEAQLNFYLPQEADGEAVIARLQEALEELRQFTDIGEGKILRGETQDTDWINNWKQFFKPFLIGSLLIKPTWEEIPKGLSFDAMIQIDPGTAFGTGSHETTRLCIEAMELYKNTLPPQYRVLDVGTGSGILGIAALQFGAGQVCGIDVDENVAPAVADNLRANGIAPEQFFAAWGDILTDRAFRDSLGCYDLVLANILAPVITGLIPIIPDHLKPGGIFIASGIINTKEKAVVQALLKEPGLALLEVRRLGEWVSIIAKRS